MSNGRKSVSFPTGFPGGDVDRYVSDFDRHVYFPRERELIITVTGFTIERTLGSYGQAGAVCRSRQLIIVGRKSEANN